MPFLRELARFIKRRLQHAVRLYIREVPAYLYPNNLATQALIAVPLVLVSGIGLYALLQTLTWGFGWIEWGSGQVLRWWTEADPPYVTMMNEL